MRSRRSSALAVLASLTVVALVVWLIVDGQQDEDAPPAYDAAELPEEFARYCDEVQEQQAAITAALEDGATTGLIRALPSFEALAEKAPDDIVDEWDVVIGRTRALESAVTDAGADPASYDREDPPPGVDREEQQRIDAAATALAAGEVRTAMAAVEQHARDVCKTPLAL